MGIKFQVLLLFYQATAARAVIRLSAWNLALMIAALTTNAYSCKKKIVGSICQFCANPWTISQCDVFIRIEID